MIHRHPSELMFLKPPSGVGRGHGRRSKGKAKPSKVVRTIEESGVSLDVQDADYIKKLESMAARQELPSSLVDSSLEVPSGKRGPLLAKAADYEKFYEAIDRVYGAPSGELGKYEVIESYGGNWEVRFRHPSFMDIEPGGRYPLGSKSSESSKSGMRKYMLLKTRPALEQAELTRMHGGFGTLSIYEKYGGRILNDAEKALATREMEAHIERLFGSPITRQGRELNEEDWRKVKGGWRRSADTV